MIDIYLFFCQNIACIKLSVIIMPFQNENLLSWFLHISLEVIIIETRLRVLGSLDILGEKSSRGVLSDT
jgi:hypothetical protein